MAQLPYQDDPSLQLLWRRWAATQTDWMRLRDAVRAIDERIRNQTLTGEELRESGAINTRLHAAYERFREMDARYTTARQEYSTRRDDS